MLSTEVWGIIAIVIYKAICAVAGVGGSPIFFPICIYMFGFTAK